MLLCRPPLFTRSGCNPDGRSPRPIESLSHLSTLRGYSVSGKISFRILTPKDTNEWILDQSERISRTLISIAAFAAEFAPRTGVTATSTPVTCVLLFLFLCSAYTTEMMRSCGRRLSPKATDSCQLSLKNRAQVGEATTYESKRVAVPISTIAISSSSVVHLLRIFAGSSRKRGLMGLLVLARSVGAATEVRVYPDLISRRKVLIKS